MKFFLRTLLLMLSILMYNANSKAQTQQEEKTEVQAAHDDKSQNATFFSSEREHFHVRVFSIKEPKINEQHHWFLQVLDADKLPVNFATLSLDAYLKEDKAIKLNYMAPVFGLCSEGKYIIGFINSEHKGEWQLDLSIDNFGKKDEISLEMEIR